MSLALASGGSCSIQYDSASNNVGVSAKALNIFPVEVRRGVIA